jgi:protein-disulfide isomerase
MKLIIDWLLKPQGAYPGRQAPPTANNARPANSLDPAKTYVLPADWLKAGPAAGPDKAPVTIVENIDYQCPFCQRGTKTLTQVLQKYPGKTRLVSKQFPLPFHQYAQKAAEAALCADEQGKYWEFREEVFGDSWEINKDAAGLKGVAKKLKLDEKKFDACLDGNKYEGRVRSEGNAAAALGVQGTPTYFINGSPLVGAAPPESMEKIIEEKLGATQKNPVTAPSGKEQKTYA